MIQFAIYQAYGGPLIADYSHKIQGASVASNNRGFAEASGFIPMSLQDAFRFYDRAGLPHVAFSDGSSGSIYEGRLEDVEITNGGINVRAYGYARAFSDFPYSALWSDTSVAHWRPALNSELVNAYPDRFSTDTNNRVYMTAQKGATLGNTTILKICYMIYQIPDQSSRLMTGISFDYTANAPVNWQCGASAFAAGFTTPVTLITITPGGGPVAGSVNLTLTGKSIVAFFLYFNAADAVLASETGQVFFSATNVRVVTSTVNRVSTLLTANRALGTNVTCTVASTANMYVGQLLQVYVGVSPGGSPIESVTVLSIGSTTTFNATFAFNHTIGDGVYAHVIYADEIAEDMATFVAAVNPTQLNASIALSQSPGRDLTDQVFVDDDRTRIMDYLCTLGDNQATPRQWEWGVTTGQLLYFRPQNSASRTWYIDVSEIDVQRTISTLSNSTYATYQEAGGRRLRGVPLNDTTSITRYGVLRQKAVPVQTTSATQATIQANAALADNKDPKPKSALTVSRIYDANGAVWPLYYVRAGDTMVIRNLPPTLSVAIDRIRIFRLTRAEYHFEDGTLTIEPESPLPTLDALLALALPAQAVNNNAAAFLSGRNPDGTYDPRARNW